MAGGDAGWIPVEPSGDAQYVVDALDRRVARKIYGKDSPSEEITCFYYAADPGSAGFGNNIIVETDVGGTSQDSNQNGTPDECEEIPVPYRVEYGYDYMGRRVRRQFFEWDAAGAAWVGPVMDTKYVYDGWRVIEELDGLDPVNPDATTRQYTWGLDLAAQAGAVNSLEQAGGIGGLLAAYDTAGTSTTADDRTFVYFYDANGNVGQVVETTLGSAGTIVAHYEYTPYGQVLVEPLFDQPYRFSTKPFDSWTGLGYWGYRWYSPKLGRWVTRDPIAYKERNLRIAQRAVATYGVRNEESFIGNSPIISWDAHGMAPPCSEERLHEIYEEIKRAHGCYNTGGSGMQSCAALYFEARDRWEEECAACGGPGPKTRPGGSLRGVEVHFFAGTGLSEVSCCKDGKRRTMVFAKLCIGGAAGISGDVTGTAYLPDCDPDNYVGWFWEGGGTIGVVGGHIDIGYTDDGDLSGTVETGIGPGLGFKWKSTWCYYWLWKDTFEDDRYCCYASPLQGTGSD